MIRAATHKFALSMILLSVLSGCSALGALSDVTTPLDVYDLRAPDGAPVVQGGMLARDVVVELPNTSGVLNTDRIMIRPDALQAQYLPDVRWGDEVPVMLQTLMVRALENTNGLRYVGRRPLAGSADYAIVTELVDFQVELGPDGLTSQVAIVLTSRLVREDDAVVISTRTFRVIQPVPSTDTPTLISAFDLASDAFLIEFADWTMTALGRRLTPA